MSTYYAARPIFDGRCSQSGAFAEKSFWVTLYLTLGYAFGHSIRFVAEISADVNGILVSFGVIFGVLWYAHHWAKRRGLLSDKS